MDQEQARSGPAPRAAGASAKAPATLTANNVSQTLAELPLDLAKLADPLVKQAMTVLLNLVERQARENAALREEIQRLRDEVNRLKGEQGKPSIKPNKKNGDISSEQERRSREPESGGERGTKRDKIKIHRTEVCPVAPESLPADAVFKGYESVLVQDLRITPENIEFQKEVYYSRSEKKTYLGALPKGYEGEFGPGIRALVLSLKYSCNMSEPKILEFLQEQEVLISAATISRLLTQGLEQFHQEKAELFAAGLECSPYQQIDDTGARVRGQNWHTQIVCNDLCAAFFTTERKERLTILDVLRQFESRTFLYNAEAARLLELMVVPAALREKVAGVLPQGRVLTEAELEALLAQLFPDAATYAAQQTRIKEATAIAAYHQETGHPVVKVLLCDDAPQFKLLTEELALCWVHDGRNYKKLSPVVPLHAQILTAFLERYWDFYAKLLAFKAQPCAELAASLAAEFDQLFATKTGYEDLDERIAKTRAKKQMLLLVLRHPELPLHNNACELEARVAVRRRDVSLHTMTQAGTRACDTMLSIVRTAKKLGLSAFKYIRDRVSLSFQLPSLAALIRARAAERSPAPCAETY